MKTSKGIFLDITESTYSYKVEEFRFFFSSEFYRQNFIERYKDFTKYEKIKFENNYKVKLLDTYIFLFTLYQKIEKRGFYVYDVLTKTYIKELPSFSLRLKL